MSKVTIFSGEIIVKLTILQKVSSAPINMSYGVLVNLLNGRKTNGEFEKCDVMHHEQIL